MKRMMLAGVLALSSSWASAPDIGAYEFFDGVPCYDARNPITRHPSAAGGFAVVP